MNTALAAQSSANDVPARITADDICKVILEKRMMFLGLILRVENDWEVAEEIFSMATVNALANAQSQFQGKSSLASYIGTIMYNTAKRHARRQATRKNTVGLFYEHELGSQSDQDDTGDSVLDVKSESDLTPEKILEQRQLLERVKQVLASLEKRFPSAYHTWHMHRLEELSYSEIEEQAGIPATLARNHVQRVSQELEKLTGVKPEKMFR